MKRGHYRLLTVITIVGLIITPMIAATYKSTPQDQTIQGQNTHGSRWIILTYMQYVLTGQMSFEEWFNWVLIVSGIDGAILLIIVGACLLTGVLAPECLLILLTVYDIFIELPLLI
ncbi:MAG: hypothetical protein ACFFCF_05880 [Promethearchaeota archaeon]